MQKQCDAILIPGGGLTREGRLPEWTRRRLDAALKMRRDEYIIVLSAGTVHKRPILDANQLAVFECSVAANYLVENGVEHRRILREWSSYDTIGNAYFARVIHTDPRQWRNLVVITSDFHMPRVREIFEWVFSLDDPRPPYKLSLVAVTDKGIDPKILKPRITKEERALQKLLPLKEAITNLRDFHAWLFQDHGAYAVASKPVKETGDVLSSY